MTAVTTYNDISQTLFWAASRLTDPPCEVDRAYKQFLVAMQVDAYATEAFLAIEMVFNAALTIFTAIPGMLMRACAIKLSENPYSYKRGKAEEKEANGSITHLTWNDCSVGAGYSTSDGGCVPFSERCDRVADKIKECDADVVNLYEHMDYETASQLIEKLENEYAHFYFNIGAQATAPNSGIFVASKVAIDDMSFTPFPKDHLDGRSKPANKGFVSFTAGKVAKIFATHLGHSEICAQPTPDEVTARKNQMNDLMKEIRKVQNLPTILTGDLNLSFQELQDSEWHHEFHPIEEHNTWLGDEWCAKLMGKPVSGPCMYDYTLHLINSPGKISQPTYIETGYDPTTYSPKALSDHKGVYTVITA